MKRPTEIVARPQRPRHECRTCVTPPGHVRADELWQRALDAPTPYRVRVPS